MLYDHVVCLSVRPSVVHENLVRQNSKNVCCLFVEYCSSTVIQHRSGENYRVNFVPKSLALFSYFFIVLLTAHRDISLQKEPTGCTVYFQLISVINLYMFRAGLLLIIRRISIPPTASQHKRMTYTNCCIYRVVPPDDEQ